MVHLYSRMYSTTYKNKFLLRNLFLYLFFTFFGFQTYAQNNIDTLGGDPHLDGFILLVPTLNEYIVYSHNSGMTCGDGIDMVVFTGKIFITRAFISFNLSKIQRDTNRFKLTNATIGVYQTQSVGDGKVGAFPIFNNQPGRYPCVLDHVDYGDTLDWFDWAAGDHGNSKTIHTAFGILSTTPTIGFKRSNVTEHVQEDLTGGKKLNQYRIRFKVDHDDDIYGDELNFSASESGPSLAHRPYLILEWKDIQTSVAESNIKIYSTTIAVFPNPFNLTTEFNFSISNASYVEIFVIDVLGRKIATVTKNYYELGSYTIRWNAETLSSGIYYAVLRAGTITKTTPLVLLK